MWSNPITRTRPRIAPIGLVVLVCACSRGMSREALLLSTQPPPPGQRCRISEREPPPLAAIADSVDLHEDLAKRWTVDSGVSGFSLVSLAIDTTGSLSRPPSVIDTDLPDATAAAIADLLALRVEPKPSVDGLAQVNESRYVRVKVTLDSTPAFQTGRSESCRPQLVNRDEIMTLLQGASPGGSGTAVVKVLVTAAGRVGEVEMVRPSGNDQIDRVARVVATRMRFEPARVDYVPVAVWVQLPIRVR